MRSSRRSRLVSLTESFQATYTSSFKAIGALARQYLRNARSFGSVRTVMTDKKPNGSTVCLGQFDIEDAQARLGEDALSGNQRQIGKMLMIDGVKLMQLHQPKEMLHFEGSDALRGEQIFLRRTRNR